MSEKINLASVDKNLADKKVEAEAGVRFYSVREEPFELYGFYDPLNEPVFKRLPTELAEKVSRGVTVTHLHTSGGRVRFSTDSPYIHIKAVMENVEVMATMSMCGAGGFDLYQDDSVGRSSRYVKMFQPPRVIKDGYEAKIELKGRKLRSFTINFPSYSSVKELYVGIEDGSRLGKGASYCNRLPIVYYGSSITQGACSSRPGNIYQNMVSRALNANYMNFGFSGSCLAEDNILDYLVKQEMCAFVCDYDHNAPTPEYLEKTHLKVYERIREARPDLPFIMLSRPDFDKDYDQSILRRNVVIDTYRIARSRGDENVYYVDGEGIFRGNFEDSCTVDGTHPNDLGFSKMAETLCCTFRRILADRDIFSE